MQAAKLPTAILILKGLGLQMCERYLKSVAALAFVVTRWSKSQEKSRCELLSELVFTAKRLITVWGEPESMANEAKQSSTPQKRLAGCICVSNVDDAGCS